MPPEMIYWHPVRVPLPELPSGLLLFTWLADTIGLRLRGHWEGGVTDTQQIMLMGSIIGYLKEHPGHSVFPDEDLACGLATHFVCWLKQNMPSGGGWEGEELRSWIRNYRA